MRLRSTIASVLAVSALVAVAGCQETAPPASEAPRWNVILLLVDTLRADRLSAYGYGRDTSPFFDSWASRSVLFEKAYSQAACTFPSVNSLLTSQPPMRFVAEDSRDWSLPAELPTLPGILADHGYRGMAVSASGVVRDTPSQVNLVGGYGAPFEVFDETCHRRDGSCVVDRALHWLDDPRPADQPFFLYLHFMDPHSPYRPPESHPASLVPAAPSAKKFIQEGDIVRIATKLYSTGELIPLNAHDLRVLRGLYDEEIRYFDSQLARLLGELDERDLSENTLIVFVSDHGEELLEHDEITHCRDMIYENVIGTPMVFRVPGGPEATRHAVPVQNLDVMPTILDLLEIDAPPEVVGSSLAAYLASDSEAPTAERRFAFASQGSRRAVIGRRFKLVLDYRDHSLSFYDLREDPLERQDAREEFPDSFRTLRKELFQRLSSWEKEDPTESLAAADAIERQLEAVGYLQ